MTGPFSNSFTAWITGCPSISVGRWFRVLFNDLQRPVWTQDFLVLLLNYLQFDSISSNTLCWQGSVTQGWGKHKDLPPPAPDDFPLLSLATTKPCTCSEVEKETRKAGIFFTSVKWLKSRQRHLEYMRWLEEWQPVE